MQMTKTRSGRMNPRSGVALVYAVFGSMVAAGMVAASLTLSLAADRNAQTKRTTAQARYLAEGATAWVKKEIQRALANWEAVPTSGTVDIDGRGVAYTVRRTGFNDVVQDGSGIQTIVTGYEIRSSAEVGGFVHETLRYVNAQATPIFQFAVFYTSDLEVNPGANMTIGGRVHTNGDMYLTSNGATLTLNTNYVRAVGEMHRNRKDNPSDSGGTVSIRKWVRDPFSPTEPSSYYTMWSRSQLSGMGIASSSGFDSAFTQGRDANGDGDYLDTGELLPWGPGALQYWAPPANYTNGGGNTVQCAEHDVGEAVVPRIGSVSMFEPVTGGSYVYDAPSGSYLATAPGAGTHGKGFYYANAGLKIVVETNGTTWTAYDAQGANVTSAVSAIAGAVTTRTMYDARQANGGSGTVRVVDIDVQKIQQSGKFPPNGLLYAAHKSPGTGVNVRGVRLVNAATLPANLTVVSEDPVYIKGDYNKGSATVPKRAAAVIADAVNLLSVGWNDTKTATTALPAATATTYNVAMISGNHDTVGSAYNGGLENLPRFHENWTGKACNIRGSLVNTWASRYATGQWVYGGNRYTAPNRNWTYDTDFNDVSKLPPFTPMAVTAVDVAML